MQNEQLSKLMRLSWTIQLAKKCSRSKSLSRAWVIYQHANLMVYFLVRKHTPEQKKNEVNTKNLTLIF